MTIQELKKELGLSNKDIMAKFSGKDEKINGKWYPVTVEASLLKSAIKKLYVGQRKSYGTVQQIRGRFSKND